HPAGGPLVQVTSSVSASGSVTVAATPLSQPGAGMLGGGDGSVSGPRTEGLFGPRRPRPQEPLPGFALDSLAETDDFWLRAKSLALASRVAYWEPTLQTARGVPALKATLSDWGFHGSQFLNRGATQCFMAWTNDTVLVAFRGTTDLSDWLANLNILDIDTPRGPVHRGFRGQFLDVADELNRLLDSHPHSRLFVTGHSLGGAIATVAAAEWADRPVRPTSVFTYGQPATGHGAFARFVDDCYPGDFHRFVNHRDIVPRVPPGYQHVGSLWKFDRAGNLLVDGREMGGAVAGLAAEDETIPLSEFTNLQRLLQRGAPLQDVLEGGAAGGMHTESLLPWIDDHAILEYLAKIEQQLPGRLA
ncbi:MAG: lipase family protein, partial [Planctomycetaceae bacterium]